MIIAQVLVCVKRQPNETRQRTVECVCVCKANSCKGGLSGGKAIGFKEENVMESEVTERQCCKQ